MDNIEDNIDNQSIIESSVLPDNELETTKESVEESVEQSVEEDMGIDSTNKDNIDENVVENENNNIIIQKEIEEDIISNEENISEGIVSINENNRDLADNEGSVKSDTALSSDTTLSQLAFYYNNTTLSEKFDPDIKDYIGVVKGNQNYVQFHAGYNNSVITVKDPYATMDIYFNDELIFEDITKTPNKTLTLVKGISNVMRIVVTAQSGDQTIYTVTFERELDSNTNIKDFSINKGSLEAIDDTYIATMDSWQDYKAILNDEKEIALNQKFDLGVGDNRLDIEVTSNNGTKKAYPVIFKRSDDIAPTVNSSVDANDWTNKDVLINITASDDSGIRYIELPSGEKVYSSEVEFFANQNGTYVFKVYDNFLNETIEKVEIDNIDKELPKLELKASTTELTNSSVDILIDASDNVAIKYIETPEGTLMTKNTLTYTVHEDGTYTFKVVDLAGNEVVKSITLNNIDSVNPILATELSNDDWSNEELILSVFAMSNKGIKYIELPDGSKVEDNVAEYNIDENGVYIISTESLGGNVTTEKVIVNNIDTELPTLSLVPSTEDWTNKDVDITINTEDNVGIDYIILPNGQTVYESNYAYSVSSNGIYEFTVVDLAGNQYTQSIEINNIDKETPMVENHDDLISVLSDIITLDISTITTSSGIYKIILPNKEEVINPTENIIRFKVSRNGIYRFIVVDNAGNSLDVNVPVNSFKEEINNNNNSSNENGINNSNNSSNDYFNQNNISSEESTNNSSNLPETGGFAIVNSLLFNLSVVVGYFMINKKQ